MSNRDIYITTASGRHFYYEDMEGSDIIIEDIAFALARLTRYCGHTPQFKEHIYSVGQHSVLMAWYAMTTPFNTPTFALATLLHDAHEFAFQDVPGPLKTFLPKYKVMEHLCDRVIEEKFNLPYLILKHPMIEHADKAIRHNEANAVCSGADNLCVTTDHPPGMAELDGLAKIEPWTISQTYDRFMQLYERLHDSQNH